MGEQGADLAAGLLFDLVYLVLAEVQAEREDVVQEHLPTERFGQHFELLGYYEPEPPFLLVYLNEHKHVRVLVLLHLVQIF